MHFIDGTATVIIEDVCICSTADALDLMASVYDRGGDSMILKKEAFPDAFFALKTGFAGEILQKFSNYGMASSMILTCRQTALQPSYVNVTVVIRCSSSQHTSIPQLQALCPPRL